MEKKKKSTLWAICIRYAIAILICIIYVAAILGICHTVNKYTLMAIHIAIVTIAAIITFALIVKNKKMKCIVTFISLFLSTTILDVSARSLDGVLVASNVRLDNYKFDPSRKTITGNEFVDKLLNGPYVSNPNYNPRTKKGKTQPQYIVDTSPGDLFGGVSGQTVKSLEKIQFTGRDLGMTNEQIDEDARLGISPSPYNSEDDLNKARAEINEEVNLTSTLSLILLIGLIILLICIKTFKANRKKIKETKGFGGDV